MSTPLPDLELAGLLGPESDASAVALLRAVLDPLPGTALLLLDRDLRVRVAEGALLETLAGGPGPLAGRLVADLLPAATVAALRPHADAVLAGEARSFRLDLAGAGAALAVAAGPVRDAAGDVAGGLALVGDLSRPLAEHRRTIEAEAHYRLLAETATEVISLHDLDGRYRYVSPSADPTFGFVPAELLGRTAFDFIHPDDAPAVAALLTEIAAGTDDATTELRFRHGRTGGWVWVEATIRAIRDPASGDVRELRVSSRDVTASKAHEERAREAADEVRRVEAAALHEALHDRVTGLPNRTLLLDRLAQALRRRGARVAVLLVDLDSFKVVNESLGHDAGDAILAEVGTRLRTVVRPGDTVAHFGGDVFAIACEGLPDDAAANAVAERVLASFGAPFGVGEHELVLSASVGMVLGGAGDVSGDLLRDADAALHGAKDRGRARWELFDPALRERVVARLRTEAELRRALVEGELRVHFQPFWALPERTLAGCEALVRWQHPERGLVGPGEFVDVAEACGLIVPLGTWVLRESCRHLAAWRRSHPAAHALKLRVNLSARQVLHPGLLPTVRAALEDHGIEPSAVGLEITEGMLLQDSDAVAATLAGLKELGVALVLDDFGTGYSSLSYLKRFPIDQLKIDRSFVSALDERDEDRAIVQAIVGMAAALGLTVVPEGVETEEQLATLVAMGAEFAQGFLLGRPLPPEAFEGLL